MANSSVQGGRIDEDAEALAADPEAAGALEEIPEPSQDSGEVTRKVGTCKFWRGRMQVFRRQLFDVRISLSKEDIYAKGKEVADKLPSKVLKEQMPKVVWKDS